MNDLGVTAEDSPRGLVVDPSVPAVKEEVENVVDPLCIENDAEEKLKDPQLPETEAENEKPEVTEKVDCDENAKEKIEIDDEKVAVKDVSLDLQEEKIKEELLKIDNSSINSTALEDDIKKIETTSQLDSETPMETDDADPTQTVTKVEITVEEKLENVEVPTKVIEEVTTVTSVLESKETEPILQEEKSLIKEVKKVTTPEPDKLINLPKVEVNLLKKENPKLKEVEIKVAKTEANIADVEMVATPTVVEEKPQEQKVEPVKVAVEIHKPEILETPKVDVQDMPKPEIQPVNGDVAKDDQPIKRRSSEELESESPLKKLCQEVEKTFPQHDTMINQYIDTATKNNVDEIQRHTEQLLSEIQTLRELAQKKEHEWNNILHLKKVKEEILLRLLRRKQVISFEKSPEVNGSSKDPFDFMTSKSLAIDKSDEISGLALKPPISSPSVNIPSHPSSMIQPPPMPVTSQYNPMAGLPPPYDKAAHMQMPRPVFPQSMMMPGPTMPFPRDMNGQMNQFGLPMGRQGPTKDVKSIIADYRQRNPDVVPRRGRRLRSILNPNMMNAPRQIAPKIDNLNNLGMIFNNLDMSQKAMLERLSQMQASSLPNGMSFKDVLVQFANIQQQSSGLIPNRPERPEPPPRPEPPRPEGRRRPERPHHDEAHVSVKQAERPSAPSPRLPPPPPYPEISLLPVTPAGAQEGSSLLHGILTKASPPAPQYSPTLAKLLTSPERQQATLPTFGQAKNCGEITITPVQPTPAPPHDAPPEKSEDVVQLDDEESPASSSSSDSTSGRLVIDGAAAGAGAGAAGAGGAAAAGAAAAAAPGEDAPLCQGCRRRDAQFVCAGCANQWYCSRDCQVAAWDDHSEMCSG